MENSCETICCFLPLIVGIQRLLLVKSTFVSVLVSKLKLKEAVLISFLCDCWSLYVVNVVVISWLVPEVLSIYFESCTSARVSYECGLIIITGTIHKRDLYIQSSFIHKNKFCEIQLGSNSRNVYIRENFCRSDLIWMIPT